MQRAAGDVGGSDVSGWPELSSGAKEDDLGLVGVELQTVLQEPQADCSRAAGECVDGRRSVGTVHADKQLRVIGELVVWHAVRLNQLADS